MMIIVAALYISIPLFYVGFILEDIKQILKRKSK